MDTAPLKTVICIHSPLTEYSRSENYYTTYAIHLKSNNPCFRHQASHVRRRYSEFVSLRELLAAHHPTLKPPALPPKNFFNRFSDEFIEQRLKGLQKFMRKVLAVPVYLSDKALHLFLQSTSSMSEIQEECLGDIPAPRLIDSSTLALSYIESCASSNLHEEAQFVRSLHHLVLDDVKIGIQPQTSINRTHDLRASSSALRSSLSSVRKGENKTIFIPKRNGSLDSSAASSPSSSSPPSSLEASLNSYSERYKERRVSFNDRVKVAVVTQCGISVLRP